MTGFADSLLYIDGALRPGGQGRMYDKVAPTTGRPVGRAADAGAEDMEAAIAAARRAFDESDWAHDHAARMQWMDRLQARLADLVQPPREARLRGVERGRIRIVLVLP